MKKFRKHYERRIIFAASNFSERNSFRAILQRIIPRLSPLSFSYPSCAARYSTRYRFIASSPMFCRFSASRLACREFLRANSVGGFSCVHAHTLWIGCRPIYVHIYSRVFYVNVEFSPEGSCCTPRSRSGSIKPEIPAHLRGCARAHEEFHEGLCNESSLSLSFSLFLITGYRIIVPIWYINIRLNQSCQENHVDVPKELIDLSSKTNPAVMHPVAHAGALRQQLT